MKQRGKVYEEWIRVRNAFIAANPPNHQGYYVCYICHLWIPAGEITVDHIVARSRSPDLRFEFSNLAFCCSKCNSDKGSSSVKLHMPILSLDDELEGLW